MRQYLSDTSLFIRCYRTRENLGVKSRFPFQSYWTIIASEKVTKYAKLALPTGDGIPEFKGSSLLVLLVLERQELSVSSLTIGSQTVLGPPSVSNSTGPSPSSALKSRVWLFGTHLGWRDTGQYRRHIFAMQSVPFLSSTSHTESRLIS
jgi:hypothetical protein